MYVIINENENVKNFVIDCRDVLGTDDMGEHNIGAYVQAISKEFALSKEDEKTLLDMNEYLINGYDDEFIKTHDIRPGVGIAAPQIDVLKKMFVILAYDEKDRLHHYGVINPKIISSSVEMCYLPTGEGCLSVDRPTKGLIHRHKRITANCYLYDFETGNVNKTTLKLKDYIAIVFQHEYDHLFGTLFVDRINKANPFYVPENSSKIVFSDENGQE